MKSNVPKPPKSLNDLSSASINRINNYYNDKLTEELNFVSHTVQRIMCKYFCCIMNDNGCTPEQITTMLANLRMYKRKLKSFKTNEEMEHWLDERIATFMEFPNYLMEGLIEE